MSHPHGDGDGGASQDDGKQGNKAGELVKKLLTVGVGAIFLTEESLRGLVSDIKIPKELLGGILDSANKTKNDFLQKLSGEILDRLKDKVDPKALIEEILARHEIDLHITMNFRPKHGKRGTSKDDSHEN